jgi:hypothetical protein
MRKSETQYRAFYLALIVSIALLAGVTLNAYASEESENYDNGTVAIEPINADLNADESESSDAAPANGEPTGPVARFGLFQYMLIEWEEAWSARIMAELTEDETLPAVVEIAVPQRAPVFYLGEPNVATSIPNPQPIRTIDGFDIYAITLTDGRIAMLEFTLFESPRSTTPDGPAITISYTPLNDVEELVLISALPMDSAPAASHFEYVATSPEGLAAFGYTFENARGGQLYETSMLYITNTEGIAENPMTILFVVIGIVVLVAAVGFAWAKFARKQD